MKRFFIIFLCILSVFTLASCNKQDGGGSVNVGDYVLPEVTSETTTAKPIPDNLLESDTSWLDCYALEYSYYDTKTGESKIAEGRFGNYYQSLDYATNTITFYSQEDGYILQYVLNNNTKSGTAAVVTGSTIDNLYSGFAMLSTCDPYFPLYNNVTEVGKDFVANRSVTRYKQTQTENGVVTKIAYIWIDDELGFASKCEQYDAVTQALELRWELLSFTRNATEEAVKVNTDAFTLSTEN